VFEFTVHGARAASAADQIDEWVHAYLTGSPGANLPMAIGLRLQRRWWIGPVRVPTASLTRICGPEPEMPYRTTPEAWEAKVSAIGVAASDTDSLPPLILEYRGAYLALCDGNHRYEALRRRGDGSVWAFIWCNSEAEFLVARDSLAAAK
jgi:hypothetical protein